MFVKCSLAADDCPIGGVKRSCLHVSIFACILLGTRNANYHLAQMKGTDQAFMMNLTGNF